MHLPSCNFCLKKRLNEPAQFKIRLQFGRAHQPIRTDPRLSLAHKEIWVIGKLASTTMVSFRPDIAMFQPRSVTGLKMHGVSLSR
jgi:hypothetical protein